MIVGISAAVSRDSKSHMKTSRGDKSASQVVSLSVLLDTLVSHIQSQIRVVLIHQCATQRGKFKHRNHGTESQELVTGA